MIRIFLVFVAFGAIFMIFFIDRYFDVTINLYTEIIGAIIVFYFLTRFFEENNFTEGVTKKFEAQEFFKELRNSQELKIYVTYSILVNSKNLSGESHSLANDFLENLKDRLKSDRRFKAQILILDPSSKIAEQRQMELHSHKDKRQAIPYIEENLWLLFDFISNNSEIPEINARLKVHVYNSIPRFALFQAGKKVWLTFYDRNRNLSESDFFVFKPHNNLISLRPPLGSFVLDNFDEVWSDSSSTYTINDYFIGRLYFLSTKELTLESEAPVYYYQNGKYFYTIMYYDKIDLKKNIYREGFIRLIERLKKNELTAELDWMKGKKERLKFLRMEKIGKDSDEANRIIQKYIDLTNLKDSLELVVFERVWPDEKEQS